MSESRTLAKEREESGRKHGEERVDSTVKMPVSGRKGSQARRAFLGESMSG